MARAHPSRTLERGAASGVNNPARECILDREQVDGLGHVVVHTGGNAVFAVLGIAPAVTAMIGVCGPSPSRCRAFLVARRSWDGTSAG